MKLMTPQVTKDKQEQQLAREVLRSEEVRMMAMKVNKDLANAESNFNKVLAGQRERWAIEELNHEKRVAEMTSEIKELNKQKELAMIPIEKYRKEVDDKMAGVMVFLEEVKRRELDVDDLVERLETKLTDVGSREIAVREGEIRLQLGLEGLQMQRVDTTEGLRKLTTQMANFKESRDQAEKDISERKAALFLWDRDLVARVERLNGIEKRLKEFEIRLKDERGVLDRIWKEIERKRIST